MRKGYFRNTVIPRSISGRSVFKRGVCSKNRKNMLPVDIHDKKLLPTNSKDYMNQNCVIYCRVSSIGDRQSNERQLRDLEEYAKSRNLIVAKTYEEKISGAKKNNERPVLIECLEYCFSEGIDILLISELSRLGRNVDEVLKKIQTQAEGQIQ